MKRIKEDSVMHILLEGMSLRWFMVVCSLFGISAGISYFSYYYAGISINPLMLLGMFFIMVGFYGAYLKVRWNIRR